MTSNPKTIQICPWPAGPPSSWLSCSISESGATLGGISKNLLPFSEAGSVSESKAKLCHNKVRPAQLFFSALLHLSYNKPCSPISWHYILYSFNSSTSLCSFFLESCCNFSKTLRSAIQEGVLRRYPLKTEPS